MEYYIWSLVGEWGHNSSALKKTTCPPVCILAAGVFLCSVQFSPVLHWPSPTQHSAAEHSASLTPAPAHTDTWLSKETLDTNRDFNTDN